MSLLAFVRRIKWILWNSAKLSRDIAKKSNTSVLHSWWDTMKFTYQYRVSPDYYIWWEVWNLSKTERKQQLPQKIEGAKKAEFWWDDYSDNRKFLNKYSKYKWETSNKRRIKRSLAYKKKYNAGEGLYVQHNVDISREHGLHGSISIGKNVLLAKNVFIDYSGEVIIGNNVQITNGVIIETHHHPFHSDYREDKNIVLPSKLVISDGAVIGSRAIILSSCNYIGKNARVGAGSVVTHDVPDCAVVVGAPAKVIRVVQK